MAQPHVDITLTAPGFQGINTEDSPINQDYSFAAEATNCVIDQFGRIGARKAFATKTSSFSLTYTPAATVDSTVTKVHRLSNGAILGQNYVVCTVSVTEYNDLGAFLAVHYFLAKLSANGSAVEEIATPALASPDALVNADIVFFNDQCLVFTSGNGPLLWTGTGAATYLSGEAGYQAPIDAASQSLTATDEINGDVATAAYGRLWVTGVDGDYNNIFYSSLLDPTKWYDGSAGALPTNTAGIIDVSEYWPQGKDRIVNIVAHNNTLVVFGRSSILLFGNPQGDPAAVGGLYLADSVVRLGLISRDGVVSTGQDILFLDDTGVRSLGRTIQEQAIPVGDLTANVRKDISIKIKETSDQSTISLSYWPEEALLVCLFAEDSTAYVLEMRAPSSSGGMKVSQWTGCTFERALSFEDEDGAEVLLASSDSQGLLQYAGHAEYGGRVYVMTYTTNPLALGQSNTLKFPKKFRYILVSDGTETTAEFRWGFGSSLEYSKSVSIEPTTTSYWGIAEWGIAQYGKSDASFLRYDVNAKGSGVYLLLGLRASIQGASMSLQEINVNTLLGRN